MAEYIGREAVLMYAKMFVHIAYSRSNPLRDEEIEKAVNEIPAADVVPVVRCKDCRHIHIGKDVYYCRYWERWGITPNGFCSSGAKLEGEA